MTEKEAKEWLESIQFEAVQHTQKALIIAIQALEKQIPKKPIKIHAEEYKDKIVNWEYLRNSYFCPNDKCKSVIQSSVCCKYCGQRLDWAEETD